MKVHGPVVILILAASSCSAIYDKKKNNPKSMAEITSFPSVVHFVGIESFYQNLRKRELGPPPLEATSWRKKVNVKKEICKSIFTSHFFIMRSEEYLDTDRKEVRAEMERDEELSDTFKSIYKKREKPPFFLFFWDKDEYTYENAYKPRTIRNGNVVEDEHTIACVVRSDGRIKDYFVTREYNVNSAYEGMPMLGRFIFARNPEGTLIMVAMAEEAAAAAKVMRQSSLIEMLYIATRSDDSHKRRVPSTDDEDPICRLTPAKQLRLCSSFFSASSEKWFNRREPLFKKDEFKFKPVENQGQSSCRSRLVSLATPGSGTFGGWFTKMALKLFSGYSTWSYDRMIACTGTTREGNKVVYYLSRGTDNNDIFVFFDNHEGEGVTMLNWFMNVSVVEKAPEKPAPPGMSLYSLYGYRGLYG